MIARRFAFLAGWVVVVAAIGWALYQHQMAGAADALRRGFESTQQRIRAETATLSVRQVMAANLTPEQWAIVENRMLTAELEFRTGANGYATWRAIRKGQPVPTTFGLPTK